MEWLLSGGALVVSVIALVHSIYAGPSLVVHRGIAHVWNGEQHVVHGVRLEIFNVGRAALPVTVVGVGKKGAGDVRTSFVQGNHPDGNSNPQFPLTLEPGQVVTVFLTTDLVVGEEIKVVQLRRNLIMRPTKRYRRYAVRPEMIPGSAVERTQS